MYPIDPGAEWGEYAVIGSSQTDDYEPLYARFHPEGTTITRWKLTNQERQAIADGQDLFIGILQCGHPFQPLSLWVDGALTTERDDDERI